LLSLGALSRSVPQELVHEVLHETGRASQRQRDLPAHVVVYYVIALALFRPECSREVLRLLLEGFRSLLGLAVPLHVAGKSGISQARTRLGEEPLRRLYERLVRPLANPQTPGAFYRQWRVVALDGTTLEVPDTEANARAFGRPSNQRGRGAFPRLRVVGLVETGTHVLFAAAQGSYATGEVTLARPLVAQLKPEMLCLADRYFPGFALWNEAAATGAALVWRIREKVYFAVEERLPDGSFLSHLYPKRQKGSSARRDGLRVRVLDYQLPERSGEGEVYRLLTTILDPEAAPADELARLYPERWEFETALDEFKTHLRGASTVLRSQTPELVRQEVWGLLLAHFALRGLMHEAALAGGRDPDRISFVHTVRVVRRTLPRFAALPPSGLESPASGGAAGDPGGGRRPSQTPTGQARGEAQAEQVPCT
jgi:hypothetical protein